MVSRESFKGFLFGAALMLVTPAFATQPLPLPFMEEPNLIESAPYFHLQYADVEEAIAQALSDRGAGSKIAVSIPHASGEPDLFQHSQAINVEIRGLRFDPKLHRFSANLVILSEGAVVSARAVSGRFDEMVEIPVLKRSLRSGELIQAQDVEVKDYPKSRLREDTVTDLASLVGQAPERIISAGRPIRTQELGQERLVRKNALVKMRYEQGALSLSTMGQALTDGVKGSVISIRNMDSKKVVQATVENADTVMIVGSEPQANDMLSSLALPAGGGVYEN